MFFACRLRLLSRYFNSILIHFRCISAIMIVLLFTSSQGQPLCVCIQHPLVFKKGNARKRTKQLNTKVKKNVNMSNHFITTYYLILRHDRDPTSHSLCRYEKKSFCLNIRKLWSRGRKCVEHKGFSKRKYSIIFNATRLTHKGRDVVTLVICVTDKIFSHKLTAKC